MQPDRTGWLTVEQQLAKGRKNGAKSIHKARKLAYKLRRSAKQCLEKSSQNAVTTTP